jgi:hypothetical protein
MFGRRSRRLSSTSGTALLELGRLEEALAVYDDVPTRFRNAVEADVEDQLNQGLVNRAVILRELGRFEGQRGCL